MSNTSAPKRPIGVRFGLLDPTSFDVSNTSAPKRPIGGAAPPQRVDSFDVSNTWASKRVVGSQNGLQRPASFDGPIAWSGRGARMELIPAIDLLGGRVVRLSRGAFDAVTDYGDDPAEVARRWVDQGATRIHIVDLDAAREGRAVQSALIGRIVDAASVPCQVAGGLRSGDAVARTLDAGADRVVLGSALIADPALAVTLIESHGPERIVAALDVRDGQALGDGWVAGARGTEAHDLARTLAAAGVTWFAVTAITRDGGMEGPDLALLANLRAAMPGASIIASGGIGRLEDLSTLAAEGYAAAIIGRALYEGAFTLPQALAAVT